MLDCELMEMKDIIISPVDVGARAKLDLRAGDTIKVWQKIKEGEKTRLQAFDGLVIARKHGREAGGTFTVRKVMQGVGVEKIFPLYSPLIDKIEILKRSKVRRAKLYHIKKKAAKEVRREMRNIRAVPVVEEESTPEAPAKVPQEESKKTTAE